jgi:aminopeptidase-like protein
MNNELGPNESFKKIFSNLFPINRSITGEGFRLTVKLGLETFNLQAQEKVVKSGSTIFDWVVPPEWLIREAWVKNVYGNKIIDFSRNNLEVLNYSIPIHKIVSDEELLEHLHTLPQKPEWIPYRTSYYERNWGFCCKHNLLGSEEFKGPFEVFINSELKLKGGALHWYELLHVGESKDEILISTYACHPSLANDNLSGLVTSLAFFKYVSKFKTKFSYRLVIIPETIGALCFLKSRKSISNIIAGFVVTTTAGPGPLGLKKSYLENHWIDKLATLSCNEINSSLITYDFVPNGSDERQYSSPEFKIPVISITNSKYHEYDEYHTSADNLEFISIANFLQNLEAHKKTFHKIENNVVVKKNQNLNLSGEFQLGKRGLYPNIGGANEPKTDGSKKTSTSKLNDQILASGWIMHLLDGKNSVLEISEKSGFDFDLIFEILLKFKREGLVEFS